MIEEMLGRGFALPKSTLAGGLVQRFDGINRGADFVRADLHIHSFGADGSYDVKDEKMTPQGIVDAAIDAGLSIISITDHNEINNSRVAVEYSEGKGILMVPGIEVSTTQGHLLVYFPDFANLRKFHGKLNISEDKERCTQGIVECLDLAAQYGGFGVLAHIELGSGFEAVMGRFNEAMEDVFCHPGLFALEISLKDSLSLYTAIDDKAERRRLVALRNQRLEFPEDAVLPKIMSSDSHSLDKLGRNASDERKLTRFKVDELSYQALKISLGSHESRVRLESVIPERFPRFCGATFKGGVLDGQTVQFSQNLTCIIGGRGTGKSTLLESVRAAAGHQSHASVVDSDVWPDEITLLYEDETGGIIEFKREKHLASYNHTDPERGISSVPFAIWGQGDVSETVKNSDENPGALLEFLDGFIEIESMAMSDIDLMEALRKNQGVIGRLRTDVKGIPDTAAQIKNLEEKIKRLEEDKVGDLVKYQTALISERSMRDGLTDEIKVLIDSYRGALSDNGLFDNFRSMSDESIIVGKGQFSILKSLLDEFSGVVASKNKELDESLNLIIEKMREQLKAWKAKEAEIQEKINEQKERLEGLGIPFDLGKINQVAVDLNDFKEKLKKLLASSGELKLKEKERGIIIAERRSLKQEICKRRLLLALDINKNLKNSVDGLLVTCKYKVGCYSPSFEQQLKGVMEWRTTNVKRAYLIASSISPLEFVEGVKKKDLSVLAAIVDDAERRVFSDADIKEIIDSFSSNYNYEDIESIAYEDRPSISVTKIIDDPVKGKLHRTRLISQLSMGQQQSILLAILVQSRSTIPLLIDQPEDHLDGEFIYKTIVSNLRKIKETRQVIVVTHNANIAVLGDAELVVPLKGNGMRSLIHERGSIDRGATINQCCEILEGGRQAFIRRKNVYGIA